MCIGNNTLNKGGTAFLNFRRRPFVYKILVGEGAFLRFMTYGKGKMPQTHEHHQYTEIMPNKNIRFGLWKDIDPGILYETLEHPNWAPWLEADIASIHGRAQFFPKGQLLLLDGTKPIANLSTNQIMWNGNPNSLPTWDDIAGNPSDYSQTYTPTGNTLVLMSMNVAPEYHGQQLPAKLVGQVQQMAFQLGIQHIVGSFRPNTYGALKQQYQQDIPFWHYATKMKTPRIDTNGAFGKPGKTVHMPVDSWLRSLTWLGMQPIKEDTTAMTVTVPVAEFEYYQQTYHPESWWQAPNGKWHCSEVGSWTINREQQTATYQESNLYGSLPLLQGAR